MAAVLDSKTLYEMSIKQTGGIIRFPKPEKAGPVIKNGGNAINELLNLVAIGLNTNRYLNERLNQLKFRCWKYAIRAHCIGL